MCSKLENLVTREPYQDKKSLTLCSPFLQTRATRLSIRKDPCRGIRYGSQKMFSLAAWMRRHVCNTISCTIIERNLEKKQIEDTNDSN